MVPIAILYHSLIGAIPLLVPILCWYQNPHGAIHLVVPSALWCQPSFGAKGSVTDFYLLLEYRTEAGSSVPDMTIAKSPLITLSRP